ncbi:hypothetical protein GQR58_019875 [Nymphon striatum]|nr:hypothetical protein GQR58_019875 [Nymphon striatum]
MSVEDILKNCKFLTRDGISVFFFFFFPEVRVYEWPIAAFVTDRTTYKISLSITAITAINGNVSWLLKDKLESCFNAYCSKMVCFKIHEFMPLLAVGIVPEDDTFEALRRSIHFQVMTWEVIRENWNKRMRNDKSSGILRAPPA